MQRIRDGIRVKIKKPQVWNARVQHQDKEIVATKNQFKVLENGYDGGDKGKQDSQRETNK